jgi:hypothetical protein
MATMGKAVVFKVSHFHAHSANRSGEIKTGKGQIKWVPRRS